MPAKHPSRVRSAVAIGSRDRELSHTPRLVFDVLGGSDAPLFELILEVIDGFDGNAYRINSEAQVLI